MPGTLKWVLAIFLLGVVLGMVRFAQSAEGTNASRNVWPNLIEQAEALGLPTQFLKEIDPNFVTVVFEDLHTYAACSKSSGGLRDDTLRHRCGGLRTQP